jgi:hypothetical protein
MNMDALTGVAQALASMVAQNTNRPMPDVTTVGDTRVFHADTPVGSILVTIEAADDPRPPELQDDAPEPVEVGDYEPVYDSNTRMLYSVQNYGGLSSLRIHLTSVADGIDNEELVPERHDTTPLAHLAQSDATMLRNAAAVIHRLEGWARYPHNRHNVGYVNYTRNEA